MFKMDDPDGAANQNLMDGFGMDMDELHTMHVKEVFIACMLALFNTFTGLCVWIPALFGDTDVVVVSVRLLTWFFQSQLFTVDGEMCLVTQQELLGLLDSCEELPIDWGSGAGIDLILQTPFRPDRGHRFFVTRSEVWRELLSAEVDVTIELSPDAVAPKALGQIFGLQSTPAKPIGLGKLTPEIKKKLPAMGVEWWGDLFSQSVRDFFEVSSSQPFHVVNSNVEEGTQNGYESIRTRVRKALKKAKAAR